MDELTEEEYIDISNKLRKILALFKKGEINAEQFIEKVFDYFFITK